MWSDWLTLATYTYTKETARRLVKKTAYSNKLFEGFVKVGLMCATAGFMISRGYFCAAFRSTGDRKQVLQVK